MELESLKSTVDKLEAWLCKFQPMQENFTPAPCSLLESLPRSASLFYSDLQLIGWGPLYLMEGNRLHSIYLFQIWISCTGTASITCPEWCLTTCLKASGLYPSASWHISHLWQGWLQTWTSTGTTRHLSFGESEPDIWAALWTRIFQSV